MNCTDWRKADLVGVVKYVNYIRDLISVDCIGFGSDEIASLSESGCIKHKLKGEVDKFVERLGTEHKN